VLIPGAIKTKKSKCTESQRNKNVLSSCLNSVRQMSCCRSSTGRLFHSCGLATPKLVSPSLDCVWGTVHVWTSADWRNNNVLYCTVLYCLL